MNIQRIIISCIIHIHNNFLIFPFSPVTTKVLPQVEPEKVRIDGPGVEKTGVKASLPVEFTVDTRDAGDADLAIAITVRPSSFISFVHKTKNVSGIHKTAWK